MIAKLVYILCGITSCFCASMLYKKYSKTRTKLLLWSCLCFVGLTLNNIVLFVDLVLVPDADLSIWRTLPGLMGVSILIFGFVWDTL